MAINGIESVVYRVDDLVRCTRFFDDYGLSPYARDEHHTHYRLDEGSNVVLKLLADPSLPKSSLNGLGVVETIWGVDRLDNLQRLVRELEHDRSVTYDAEGTARTHDDDGLAIGFRLFQKTPVFSAPDPTNSPGNLNRINQHRKWKTKARPKQIQHVVFVVPDFDRSFAFYRDRLRFRLSDYQKTFGIFARADGTMDHHNIYFLNANLKFPNYDGRVRFGHVNFQVENIDEIMIGANHMERCGWPKSIWGLGRHRISSALFNYLPCPAGGEVEYGTDSDAIDDSWIPRVWNPLFGLAIFLHNLQPWIQEAPPWDVEFAPGYTPLEKTNDTPQVAASGEAVEAQLQAQSVAEISG